MTGTVATIEVDTKIGDWRVLRVAHRRALCRCRCNQVHEVAVEALENGSSLCVRMFGAITTEKQKPRSSPPRLATTKMTATLLAP